MSAVTFGTEERLVRELLETVATEYCWAPQLAALKVEQLLGFLADATSFEKAIIQTWYNEVLEKVSKRVRLDIKLNINRLQADKTKAEMVANWGVFALAQVFNSENQSAACEKARETVGRVRSRSNSVTDINQSGISTSHSSSQLAMHLRKTLADRRRNDSERYSNFSEDEILSPSPKRKSVENLASSAMTHSSNMLNPPMIEADWTASSTAGGGRKRSLTQADPTAGLKIPQDGTHSDSSSRRVSASDEQYDASEEDGQVVQDQSPGEEETFDLSSEVLSQVTGVAKADGIFDRPKLDFDGVVCNKQTALLISLWFRYLESEPESSSDASSLKRGSKHRASDYGSLKRKKGLWRLIPGFGKQNSQTPFIDNKTCLGWTVIPMSNHVNSSSVGWISLPRNHAESEKTKEGPKHQRTSSIHWNRKPLTDGHHSKEFQVELQMQTHFHRAAYTEFNGNMFKEAVKTYSELARVFYRHAVLRQDHFTGELSIEASHSLSIFGRHKNLSELTMRMLNLSAVMSLRSSTSTLFLEANMSFGYINSAVKLHLARLNSILPKQGFSERPKSGTLERPSSLNSSTGQLALHLSSSAPLTLNRDTMPVQTADSVAKLALPVLISQSSTFVSESVRLMDEEAPTTFPLSDDAVEYLQKRIQIIWDVMNASYMPEDVREMLTSTTRRQFANRFCDDARNWFIRRLDGKQPEKTGNTLGFNGVHMSLMRRASNNHQANKPPQPDSLDQLREKITTLIEAIQEATKHCTPRLAVLNQLRTYRLSYFASVAAGIDTVAADQVQAILPRFVAYQRKHQMFQSNMTITSRLSFKLYRVILDFTRLTRESISCTDAVAEIVSSSTSMPDFSLCSTPNSFSKFIELNASAPMRNSESLSHYEAMFQPCIVYWLHAFRDLSITRIRDAVSTDTNLCALYEKQISVSAYDTVTCISEMIAECRVIEFTDPKQSMLINIRSVDIACELVILYATAIIKQAYVVSPEMKAAVFQEVGSPKVRRRKSSAGEMKMKEARGVGERMMRALSNIQHVSEEVWRRLEATDAAIEIVDDHFSVGQSSMFASRDTGIAISDITDAAIHVREGSLIKQLIDNCRDNLSSITLKTLDVHGAIVAQQHEHIIANFLDQATGPAQDELFHGINTILTAVANNLDGELTSKCIVMLWSNLCKMMEKNLKLCGRKPLYYSKVLKALTDLLEIFSAFQTDTIVMNPVYLRENDSFKALHLELTARSMKCRELIKMYLQNVANCDQQKLSPNKKKREVVLKHFKNDVENEPLVEGELFIQCGKVSSEGKVVLAIHGIRTECSLDNMQLYYQVSLKPDFEFAKSEMFANQQNRHETREFQAYEFSGLTKEQLQVESNMLVIEVWRRRLASCDSFIGELIIPLVDIPEGMSRTNIFDHTETKTLNFYQPRTLNHLLDIMHTREQFSKTVPKFLRWRLSILLRVDLRCVVRANQLKLQQNDDDILDHQTTLLSSTPPTPSPTPRPSTNSTTSTTSSLSVLAGRVRAYLPDTQAVMLTMKAHKALVGLNLASHRNDLMPTCFVRYIHK